MSIKRRMKEKTQSVRQTLAEPHLVKWPNKLFWGEKIINAQITN